MRLTGIAIVAFAGLAAAACSNEPKFTFEPGVCYNVAQEADQKPELQVLARDQAQIELCAARLEEMRLRFLRMGGNKTEVVGAYQGRFIFIDRDGVKFGNSLNGGRFFAMARTGDGRLAMPGAITRDPETGRPVAVAAGPTDQ